MSDLQYLGFTSVFISLLAFGLMHTAKTNSGRAASLYTATLFGIVATVIGILT